MSSDLFALVALSRVPSVGARLFRALTTTFTTAQEVLRARPRELMRVGGVAETIAGHFSGETHLREAEAILSFTEREGIDILCTGSSDYPTALLPFEDAPPVLYHYGQTDFENPRTLAVVGTRKMSAEGARQVERLLDPLSGYDPLIISGLAYGVDVAAHRRSLRSGMATLAVMGSGFEHVYPAAHAKLARQIGEHGGGVLTEYPPWIPPDRKNFPARNRIVAMLAAMTVVVESDLRGGSMITAGMAKSYGKLVGACPGRGGDPLTAGCNDLIKAGARLITGGDEVIKLLKWKSDQARGKQIELFQQLDELELGIVNSLKTCENLPIDSLQRSLGLSPGTLAATLLTLEMKGVITTLPGPRYRLS